MKTKLITILAGLFFTGILLTSCKKDKEEENEEEVITTMVLTFIPDGGGPSLVYEYDDPDGPDGTDPTQDEIVLAPATSYHVTVQLLNRTENPAEDITTEVEEEAAAHRFYYEPTAGSNITVSGLNNDPNGVPLGITSTWTTGAAATGKVKITLRHYAGNPPGKETADPVNSGKSNTDIEVEFDTNIQ